MVRGKWGEGQIDEGYMDRGTTTTWFESKYIAACPKLHTNSLFYFSKGAAAAAAPIAFFSGGGWPPRQPPPSMREAGPPANPPHRRG